MPETLIERARAGTASVVDIDAGLTAIVTGAEGRNLTAAEVADYETLEGILAATKRSDDIRAKHAATQRTTPPLHPGTSGSLDDRDAKEIAKAFRAFMISGRPNQDITHLQAAQNEGAGPEGGYLVPDEFRQKIVERMKAFGGIANVAEEFNTETGASVTWPTVDDTGNVGEIVAEGGTFSSGADIVFGETTLGAYKYMSGGGSGTPIRVSVELAQDSAFDLEGLVSRLLGMRLGRVQAVHLATGNGANQPKGLVHGLTGVEILADGNGVTYPDLINFIHSVDPAYREANNCRWVMNDTMLATIQKIVDSHGDPIWSRMGPMMDAPLQSGYLLGYPITIDQALPNMTAASNTINWGAFGDIRAGYVVRRVKDVTLIVNPWTRASNGQIEYTAWSRMDATQQDTNAYVALTGEQ